MTEKERTFRNAELTVRDAECRLRESRIEMDQGIKKAMAEFEREKATLTRKAQTAEIQLEKDRNWLAEARAVFEKGFE